jgi:hypothetical protein
MTRHRLMELMVTSHGVVFYALPQACRRRRKRVSAARSACGLHGSKAHILLPLELTFLLMRQKSERLLHVLDLVQCQQEHSFEIQQRRTGGITNQRLHIGYSTSSICFESAIRYARHLQKYLQLWPLCTFSSHTFPYIQCGQYAHANRASIQNDQFSLLFLPQMLKCTQMWYPHWPCNVQAWLES